MHTNLLVSAACAAAVATPLWFAWPTQHRAAVLPPVEPSVVAATVPPGIAPATGPVVTFPDGTTRPVLNGVDEPVTLQWTSGRPYAPVVEVVEDKGTQWFRHQDGSWSTTLRRLDQASGKYVTLCPLFEPGPAKTAQLRGR